MHLKLVPTSILAATTIALLSTTSAPIAGTVDGAGNTATVNAGDPVEQWLVNNGATLVVNEGAELQEIAVWNGSTINMTGAAATSLTGYAVLITPGVATGAPSSGTFIDSTLTGTTAGVALSISSVSLTGSTVIGTDPAGSGIFSFGSTVTAIDSAITGEQNGVHFRPAIWQDGELLGDQDNLSLDNSKVESKTGSALLVDALDIYPDNANILVANGSSVIAGNGIILEVNGGSYANLTVDSSNLEGNVQVDAASSADVTLQNNASLLGQLTGVRNLAVNSGAAWNMIADSSVTNLSIDGGTVAISDGSGAAFHTLTVTGDYQSNGGVISMTAVLGGDTSPTDRLVIGGNTSGNTILHFTNAGGAGELTEEGIEVVSVSGNSAGTFELQDGYIVAGAYTYRLHQNNASGTDPNDWFLRSELETCDNGETGNGGDNGGEEEEQSSDACTEFHVGAPVYESYAQSLLGLNGVGSLHERVGNRFWAGGGNRVIAEGADAIVPYAAPEEAGVHVDGNGVWGRIEGSHNSIDPRFSTTGTEYKQNTFKLQAGVDGLLTENENGTLIGGIFVQYVHGKTKTNSGNYADGEISTDGYGFGGTLTWYGNEGFYIDSQAQVTWYDSDLTTSAFGAPTLTDGNNGIGYALSLETGKRFAIDPEWSVTPQAQLVYSSVDFDDFTDGFGSHVSLDRGDSLQGRLGITLDHENSWQNARGLMNRSHVYGIANLYYEFLEGTKVNIEDVSFASKKDRLWGGIGIGGSYNWDNDKYSIYGEGIVNTSLNNFGDSYSLKGNVGFRVKW